MEIKEITKAIIKVMNEINWVEKNMTVWTGNNSYKWVSDKDVKILIRESMIKNWLSILPIWWKPKIQIDRWEQEEFFNKQSLWMKTKQSVFTEIEATYLLMHTSGESIQVYWYGQWVDTQDKWAGKATTYALKNTLLNMFLIPTGVDTDNTHSDDIEVPKTQTSTKIFPKTESKRWLNYKDFVSIVDAWNTTEAQIRAIIKEDWYSVSNAGQEAIRHYLTTWEIDELLFFKK